MRSRYHSAPLLHAAARGTLRPPDGRMITTKRWLDHLVAHLRIARLGNDPEGVHQLRVAAGRLDTWLRLARMHAFRDDLRWLRDHASAVRDLDVVLATRPPQAWAAHLRGVRTRRRRALVAALDDERVEALVSGLESLAPLSGRRAEKGVRKLRRRVLERGRAVERHPAPLRDWHALRRAVRRLRYGLEWVGEPVRELKAMQDALGTLNDLAVARRLLSRYPRRRELPRLADDLDAELLRAEASCSRAWVLTRERLEFNA